MARLSLVTLLLLSSAIVSGTPVQKQKRKITLHEGKPRRSLAERAALRGRSIQEEMFAEAAKVAAKYERNVALAKASKKLEKRAGTATLPLTDEIDEGIDEEYYGTLGIGTPTQSITFDFDTGSSDLWVPNVISNGVDDGTKYNQFSSSTYKATAQPFEVVYGSGAVLGTVATETVRFGSLTSTKQYFGNVRVVSEQFDDDPATGLCGLAYQSIASTGQPPLPFNLHNEGQLAAAVFGVRLTRGTSSGAEITMGGVSSDYAGSAFKTTPVTSQTYYEVASTGMTVKNAAASGGFPAAIDTGTTLLYVPTADAQAFYSKIPGAKATSSTGGASVPGVSSATATSYTYPCSFQGPVGVSFNGIGNLNFAIADLNIGSAGNGQCNGAVMGLDIQDANDQNFAIVGDTFIKSYYTLFNFGANTVGFTPAHNNA